MKTSTGSTIVSRSPTDEYLGFSTTLGSGDYVLEIFADYFTSDGGGATNVLGSLQFDQLVVNEDVSSLTTLKARFTH